MRLVEDERGADQEHDEGRAQQTAVSFVKAARPSASARDEGPTTRSATADWGGSSAASCRGRREARSGHAPTILYGHFRHLCSFDVEGELRQRSRSVVDPDPPEAEDVVAGIDALFSEAPRRSSRPDHLSMASVVCAAASVRIGEVAHGARRSARREHRGSRRSALLPPSRIGEARGRVCGLQRSCRSGASRGLDPRHHDRGEWAQVEIPPATRTASSRRAAAPSDVLHGDDELGECFAAS